MISTIEEQMLFSTLKIESIDENSNVVSIGTGFLISRKIVTDKNKIYLISNKHVLLASNSIRLCFCKVINGTYEPDIGNIVTIPIHKIKQNAHFHLNPEIDVAVMEVTGLFNIFPGAFYFKAIDYEMLADFTEEELNIAQNVLFIGYPDDRYDRKNNLPLVRSAIIASHPKYDYDGIEAFIIDGQVFPGSSGSPVVINLTFESWKTGSISIGQNKYCLLGIVAATMIRNNSLQVVDTSIFPNMSTQEVIGLGIVFKATAIKQIIDSMPIIY